MDRRTLVTLGMVGSVLFSGGVIMTLAGLFPNGENAAIYFEVLKPLRHYLASGIVTLFGLLLMLYAFISAASADISELEKLKGGDASPHIEK